MMYDQQLMSLPGITPQEYMYLQTATTGLTEQQKQAFIMIYSSRRKSPSDMLLFCLIGFLIPGLQRFVVGQLGMGILFFFTLGLCYIGTIVDTVNHKEIAFEHNQKMVFETMQIVRMTGGM